MDKSVKKDVRRGVETLREIRKTDIERHDEAFKKIADQMNEEQRDFCLIGMSLRFALRTQTFINEGGTPYEIDARELERIKAALKRRGIRSEFFGA